MQDSMSINPQEATNQIHMQEVQNVQCCSLRIILCTFFVKYTMGLDKLWTLNPRIQFHIVSKVKQTSYIYLEDIDTTYNCDIILTFKNPWLFYHKHTQYDISNFSSIIRPK